MGWILKIMVVFAILMILFLLFWKFYFLRDPDREIPNGDVVVSPADGKVIKVLNLENIDSLKIKKGLLGQIETLINDVTPDGEGYMISIFMSPFNVHVNRAPIPGRIVSLKHSDGKLLPVTSFARGLANEKNEMIIENQKLGKIKVIQIAGFVARRIVCNVEEGEFLDRGERFGLINLGSQLTVILPKNVTLSVKEGDKVVAGESIIARY